MSDRRCRTPMHKRCPASGRVTHSARVPVTPSSPRRRSFALPLPLMSRAAEGRGSRPCPASSECDAVVPRLVAVSAEAPRLRFLDDDAEAEPSS